MRWNAAAPYCLSPGSVRRSLPRLRAGLGRAISLPATTFPREVCSRSAINWAGHWEKVDLASPTWGWDTVLKRKVAVKEYFPTFLVSREVSLTLDVTCHTSGNQPTYEKGREQFLREAKTMARLDSIPEIVQVLDHFPEHNTAYIVMEFLEGRTLKEVVAQSGPIPADTMLALLEPVLRAMECHAPGGSDPPGHQPG